jgi:hypothetical protein
VKKKQRQQQYRPTKLVFLTAGAARSFAARVAFGVPLFDGVAFIEFSFAFGEGEFDFGLAAFPIELEGDEGETFGQGAAEKAFDFAAVEQELAGAPGVVLGLVGLFVGADVHVVEKDFAVADAGKGFVEVALAEAEAFDLGADEGESGLDGIFDEEVEAGLAIENGRAAGLFRLVVGISSHGRDYSRMQNEKLKMKN